ncbi:uncharacterized protein LOC129793209 [Lutzomyia longipalpis]|uniref:Putative conserved plasma membrane protein n=1 Tax=Lutzomyia longipalpis TaxID=7200 RepID=A0A1B0CI78_LUTLO|nr:uncharacterized protein LOC129793209 [Lutzomyia longipalpis]
MSMKRLAVIAAVSSHNSLSNNSISYYSVEKGGHQGLQTMRPGANLHGNVNVLLGGAMLSVVITVVCFVCYCCHRTIKKRSTSTYRQRWLETDTNMEIYSVEQCYDTSGIYVDTPEGVTVPGHGPPPSYDQVVALDEMAARHPGAFKTTRPAMRHSQSHPGHFCPFMLLEAETTKCPEYAQLKCDDSSGGDGGGQEEAAAAGNSTLLTPPDAAKVEEQILSPRHIVTGKLTLSPCQCQQMDNMNPIGETMDWSCSATPEDEDDHPDVHFIAPTETNGNTIYQDTEIQQCSCTRNNNCLPSTSSSIASAHGCCCSNNNNIQGVPNDGDPNQNPGPIDFETLNENGLVRIDISQIIDKTGLPTYEAAIRLESSGYV